MLERKTNGHEKHSTFTLVTFARLFEQFGMRLTQFQLDSLLDYDSLYKRLFNLPTSNISNGILLIQMVDNQAYFQKIMVSFLLHQAESMTEEDEQSEFSKLLESNKQRLQEINVLSRAIEDEHLNFISETQRYLKSSIQPLKAFLQSLAQELKSQTRSSQSQEEILADLLFIVGRIAVDKLSDVKIFSEFIIKDFQLNLRPNDVESLLTFNFQSLLQDINEFNASHLEKNKQISKQLIDLNQQIIDSTIKFKELVVAIPGFEVNAVSLPGQIN